MPGLLSSYRRRSWKGAGARTARASSGKHWTLCADRQRREEEGEAHQPPNTPPILGSASRGNAFLSLPLPVSPPHSPQRGHCDTNNSQRRGKTRERKGEREGSRHEMAPPRSLAGALARLAGQLAAHPARARGAPPRGHTTAGLHTTAGAQHSGAAPGPPSAPLGGSEAVALIQGADRGIGLQFVEQLLSRYSNTRVVATCVDPGGADHLDALHDQTGGRLEVLPLDVTQEGSIKSAAAAVGRKYGGINLLVNCSGIFHVPNLLQPESTMRWLDPEAVLTVFKVNALGPMMVTKYFTPLLEEGAKAQAAEGSRLSVLANLSSRTGSISENKFGGWYSYRASKAALNQFTKTTAAEFESRKLPVVALALYPGTVDTDLTRPYQKYIPQDRIFTTQFAVARLLDIIENASPQDNGRFIAWDGKEVPW